MRKLIPAFLMTVTGLVTVGLMAGQAQALSGIDDAFAKRDDDAAELVLVDDDTSRFTGASRSTNDGTRSNFTAVSRDRDLSRSDKTRDRTYDGVGGKKRDWSGGRTNDRSRNDSRG